MVFVAVSLVYLGSLFIACCFFLWSGTHEKYQICLRVFYFRFDKIIISFCFFFHEIKNLFMHLEQAKTTK